MFKFAKYKVRGEGESLTDDKWYYGVARRDFDVDGVLMMLVPFNAIYNLFYRLSIVIRYKIPNKTRSIEAGYREKIIYLRGYEAGLKAAEDKHNLSIGG